MSESESATVPHSRDNPPWSQCGDLTGPDAGKVFIWPAAGRGVMLSFDRRGRRHALTLFDRRDLLPEIIVHGRRFTVDGVAAESPAS